MNEGGLDSSFSDNPAQSLTSLSAEKLKEMSNVSVVEMVEQLGDRKIVLEKMNELGYVDGFRLRLAQSLVFGTGEDDKPMQKANHVINTTWSGIKSRLEGLVPENNFDEESAKKLMDQSLQFVSEALELEEQKLVDGIVRQVDEHTGKGRHEDLINAVGYKFDEEK